MTFDLSFQFLLGDNYSAYFFFNFPRFFVVWKWNVIKLSFSSLIPRWTKERFGGWNISLNFNRIIESKIQYCECICINKEKNKGKSFFNAMI